MDTHWLREIVESWNRGHPLIETREGNLDLHTYWVKILRLLA